MSTYSSDDSLFTDASNKSTIIDSQHYCNYPEISKSRHKLVVTLYESLSISSDLSSTLPSLISDISEPFSKLNIRLESNASDSLHNYLSSSSRNGSYDKCEEEGELEDNSEELYTDTHSTNDDYIVFKNNILKDIHTAWPISSDPLGWIKFSLDLDPWSKTHYANNSHISKNKILTQAIIAANSCEISQLPDNKAFALIRLHINKKGLEDISLLSKYRYFQYIDMSRNYISDINSLSNCDYLMYLNASHNKLTDVLSMKPPWFLVYCNLSCNEIKEIGDQVQHFWSLRYLDLSYNHILKIEGLNNLNYLEYLNLSHNHIETVEHFDCPKLEELHIECNNIFSFDVENVSSLPHLKVLELNHNKISSLLPFVNLQTINKLNLNDNCINDLCQLSYLSKAFKLQSLNVAGNPVCHSPGYREFVVYKLKSLKTLDDILVTSSERVYAKLLLQPDIFSRIQSLRTNVELWNQLATPRIDVETKPYDQGSVPILVLIGTFSNYKEKLADMLVQEYPGKTYRIRKHTTLPLTSLDDQSHLISVSMDEFNSLIKGGELLLHYKEVGNFFGVHREELCNLILQNKIGVIDTVLEAAMVMRLAGLKPYMVLCVTDNSDVYSDHLRNLFDKLELWSKYNSQVCESCISDKSDSKLLSVNLSDGLGSNMESEPLQVSIEDSTEVIQQEYGFNQCDPNFIWTWSIDSTISTKESEPDAEHLNKMRGKEIFICETLSEQNLYVDFNNQQPGLFKATVLTDNLKIAFKKIKQACIDLTKETSDHKTILNVKDSLLSTEFVRERVSFLIKDCLNKSAD